MMTMVVITVMLVGFPRNSPTPLGASSASFRSFLVPVLPGEFLSTRSVANLGFRVEGFSTCQ